MIETRAQTLGVHSLGVLMVVLDEQLVVEAVHAALRDRAQLTARGFRAHPWRKTHFLEGSGDDNVAHLVGVRLGLTQRRLADVHTQCLRRVFHEAIALGLIVPGAPDQEIGRNDHLGIFTFTTRGLDYYTTGNVALEHETALAEALRDLRVRRPDAVADGQLVLLAEAHHCWRQACYRAANVLIGLANEESLIELLDGLAGYSSRDPANAGEWDRATNPANNFRVRFEAGMAILRRLATALQREARRLRQAGTPPAWGNLWDRSVDALHALGEAVRGARNRAAHDAGIDFRRSDTGLLLASMPTLLEHVSELREFLRVPPPGLVLPMV